MTDRDVTSGRIKEDEEALRGLPGDVVRALEWLRSHLHEPVRVEALAAVAGVRARTLETHFRKYLRTTPLGWVRAARLANARRQLLARRAGDTVTAVAFANGFNQLGRFAAYYRDRFGELPSETLRRVEGGPDTGIDARDEKVARLTWEAFSLAFAVAPKECTRALELLEDARRLAPNYALATSLSAWCWAQRAAHRFAVTREQDRARSLTLAAGAAIQPQADAMTHMLVSSALTLAHRIEQADHHCAQALAIDPWSPFAWVRRGWLSAYQGDYAAAVRELRLMLHLMPFEPVRHLAFIGIGCAHFGAGRYEAAARWARAGLESYPQSFWAERIVAAAAAHAGARAEARRAVRRLLAKDADLTVAEARNAWPFPADFVTRLAEGLAIAGLPRG
jgi:AraC-like DNA-binding protein